MWQDYGAMVTVLLGAIAIIKLLLDIRKGLIRKAVSEELEKKRSEARITSLEDALKSIGQGLADHIEHTAAAIDAMRNEIPTAISNAVSSTNASMLQMHEKLYREFFETLREDRREDLRNAVEDLRFSDLANAARMTPKQPRTKQTRATKAPRTKVKK